MTKRRSRRNEVSDTEVFSGQFDFVNDNLQSPLKVETISTKSEDSEYGLDNVSQDYTDLQDSEEVSGIASHPDSVGMIENTLLSYTEQPCNEILVLIAETIDETNSPIVMRGSKITYDPFDAKDILRTEEEALPSDYVAPADSDSTAAYIDIDII